MTLGELLHSLDSPSLSTICQSTLYFLEKYEGKKNATVGEIKSALKTAGFRKKANSNISRALDVSGAAVHIAGTQGRANLWALTTTGRKEIAKLLPEGDRGEPIHQAGSLRDLSKSLDKDTAAYVDESIKCLESDALHAAVVFLWAGAVRNIQDRVVKCPKKDLDTAARKYSPKAPTIRKVDHLSYVQESALLLISEQLGLFDRNERAELEKCLDLRNRCGHPGKYRPGPKKVSSFIEDVSVIVFGATQGA
ncbi:MAG: hypothetical protein AAGD00_04750 [Planctomycetota bacterium]